MTTDTIDTPAEISVEGVAEQTPATQLDTQPDSVQNPEATQGDTPEQSTETTPDASLDSFLKERGLDSETEGDGVQTEQVAKAPSAEVLAEAQRLAQEQRATEERQRYEEGIRQSFSTRTQRLRTSLYNAANGRQEMTPEFIEAVVNEFTQHHGQIAPVVEAEAMGKAAQTFNNTLFSAVEKELPGISKGSYDTTTSFVKAVVETARKGYVRESDVKPRIKQELLAYKAHMDKLKQTPASTAPPEEGGNTPTTYASALERALYAPIKDPNS